MKQRHIQHLYWRAGFGIRPKQLRLMTKKERGLVVDDLFYNSERSTALKVDTSGLENYTPQMLLKSPKTRREFINKSVEKLKALNYAWIERLASPQELLREKMTLFWANHFVCEDKNIFHVQQFNNTLRSHALGDFRDFVKAVSKEAAMIKYLNTKQNKKQKPNENFARELMELFTLGMGNYNEEDIKESARAFTGYDHHFSGEFYLKKRQHDYGFKSFFGRMGRYDGDDIIDIILEQEQCARFISEKIYRYFVNDVVNPEHIDAMVKVFYPNYNIKSLMHFVFMSDWFYNEEHIGTKIKSPIEFIIGIQNTVPLVVKKEIDVLKIQKLLGQVLLHPPNVAGWQGGKGWIDTNTIMMRLKLPSILLNDAFISTKEKGDFNDTFKKKLLKRRRNKKLLNIEPKWNEFDTMFRNVPVEDLQSYVIASQINNGTAAYLEGLNQFSKKESCIQLMSLPEYQMC